jgi:regulator of protease activity HflC (stomatin/prohibitin superfamily)
MQNRTPSREVAFRPLSGYLTLCTSFALLLGAIACFALAGASREPGFFIPAFGLLLLMVLMLPGHFIVEPNQGRVLVLFGNYRGVVRESGFWWTNPFTIKKKNSLRAHNLNGKTLKVNDLLGNPIEIAAIVVWRVEDAAQATFDVEGYEHFIEVQSESAVRAVASRHPYDDGQASDVHTTLRGSAEVVAQELQEELRQRLTIAGIQVLEARLSHLAYAQEIAAAMLQRQQATAILAARAKIVEGAVSMVEMALQKMSEKQIVQLDEERKATLVGNLLVVLCGQSNPHPVINTGSLYN